MLEYWKDGRLADCRFPSFQHSNIPLFRVFAALLLSTLCCYSQRHDNDRPPPLDPAEGERQARILVNDLLSKGPEQNITNRGTLRVEHSDGGELDLPLTVTVFSTPTNWQSIYKITTNSGPQAGTKLVIIHAPAQPTLYFLIKSNSPPRALSGVGALIPFAGSDFLLADLGLEFLHWPKQRVIKKDMRQGHTCQMLESTAPDASQGSPPARADCARIVSWIDVETGGILHADVYDADNHLVRHFDPTKFKKVNGEYQLNEVEIRNRKTDSRTWIEFNVQPK